MTTVTQMQRAEFSFSTSKKFELVKITDQVQATISKLKIKDGAALVFAPHATGAIILCEDEPGLLQDLLAKVRELFPPGEKYAHHDQNAAAHLTSSFIGCSQTIPVNGGKLVLGTWQDLFFLETDGPRAERKIVVSFF